MRVTHFKAVKKEFVLDVKVVIEMEDTPPPWTMEAKDLKRVKIMGISDKHQITAILCCTMTGMLLPLQLIYQDKPVFLPTSFPVIGM